MKKIISHVLAVCLVFTLTVGITPKAEEIECDDESVKTPAVAAAENGETPPIGHRVLNYHFVDNDKTMTDEELFGEYDAETQTWVVPSKFDYDAFANMSGVKEAAMNANGDYTLAKERFKEYYKEKKHSFNVVAPNNSLADDIAAKLNSEQMYFGQGTSVLDIISMNNEYATVEVDITERVKRTKGLDTKNLAMVIMGLRKDGSSAEIDSSEAGSTGPVIDVRLSTGATLSFTADKDTYVSAGDNRDKAYGTEKVLKAEESVSSIGTTERVDTNTKRTSIVFNMDGRLSADDNVTSATLKLHGRNAAGTGKMYLAILLTDTANWTEETTWVNYPNGQIAFSYYGEEYQLNHKMLSKTADIYPNANFRYTEDICRTMFYTPFYNRYYYTRDEFYAQAYVKTVGDFMLQHSGEEAVNKTLDLANRRQFAQQLPVMIDSEYATPEWVAALAKHVWGAANYMKTRFTGASNWGTAEAAQLYAIGAYFPEFKDAYDWTTNMNTSNNLRSAAYRVKYVLENNIRDDFSCYEHAGAYVDYFISTITSIFTIGKVTGVPFVLDDETKEKLINVTRYLVDISGPGFSFIQWGDEGGYTGTYAQPLSIGREYNDPILLYAGTYGKEGEKPSHTSVFYPQGKIAAMRTGWDKRSYFLFTDFGGMSTHGHHDDLALIVFAKGKYLLTDQAMADYSSTQYTTLQQLESHNVVITDGQQQLSTGQKPENSVPGETNDWVTNDSFDFLAGTIKDKGDNSWKRNIMFIRGDYWIVTDYMTPKDLTKDTTYRQLWHMLSTANPSFEDDTKIFRSRFDDVNIQVVPLNPENLTTNILTGLQGGAGVKDAKYGEYTKVNQGITTFNTVLRPETALEDAVVETSEIPLPDVSANGAVAMNISIASTQGAVREETDAVYYLVNDDTQIKERSVGELKYDGKMFYRETDKSGNDTALHIYQGGKLSEAKGKVLFQYSSAISDFAIEFGGGNIYMSSSLPRSAIQWQELTFAKQNNVKAVYYNGEPVAFNQTENYIYFGSTPVIRDTATSTPVSTPGTNTGTTGSGHGSGGGVLTPTQPGKNPEVPTGNFGLTLSKEKGIAYMMGYDNGTIRPDAPITRGEAVTALYRLVADKTEPADSEIEFPDVTKEDFAYEAVHFMSKNKIISGYEDGTFRPKDEITRGEFAKVIASFVPNSTGSSAVCPYTDIASNWARQYIETIFHAGWINGYPDKTFRPDDSITRAEFMVMMNRALGREPNPDEAGAYGNYFTDIDSTHWAYADVMEAAAQKKEQEPSAD